MQTGYGINYKTNDLKNSVQEQKDERNNQNYVTVSPGIDSKEPMPPGCVAWRAGMTYCTYSYSVLSPQRLFKNSQKIQKYGLKLPEWLEGCPPA
jgi:hypothetical protein